MITYYTDGSASPNPGPGGFSVIRNGQPYMLGGEPSGAITTNIRMEGLAIKTALADAAGEECQIFTDSEFWINVITKWAPGWEANAWKKKGGEIKNLDIVQEVYPLFKASQATLTWVRGHEGDEGNELADEWANKARERRVTDPIKISETKPMTENEYAHAHLRVGRTMQLATLRDGQPYVCSVYFVPSDDDKTVYWLSESTRRHSQAILENASVAGAVVVKESKPVIGLQFTGTASVVVDHEEIKQVMTEYVDKYSGQGADFYERVIAGTNKHRLYKMTLRSLEMFDEVHFVDESPLPVTV